MYHPAHLKYIFDEPTQTYVDLNAPDLDKFPEFTKVGRCRLNLLHPS